MLYQYITNQSLTNKISTDEEGMDWQDNEADVETADENENKLKELDVGRATKIHVMLLKHVLPALNQCLTHKVIITKYYM